MMELRENCVCFDTQVLEYTTVDKVIFFYFFYYKREIESVNVKSESLNFFFCEAMLFFYPFFYLLLFYLVYTHHTATDFFFLILLFISYLPIKMEINIPSNIKYSFTQIDIVCHANCIIISVKCFLLVKLIELNFN